MGQVVVLSDEDLMIRAAQGSRSAFEALVHRWDRAVLRYFQRFTGSEESSRDLRQELFFRLYRARGAYNPQGKFSSWLYRMAHNLAVDLVCRKRSVGSQLEEQEAAEQVEDVNPGARERIWEREIGEILVEAMQRLSAEERTVLILKHDERISFEQIAAVLDCPVSTVKSRMYRSFAKLRGHLRSRGVDLSTLL
jgi:RNA polymerase sigma-70 factor (ECF subfamily)